MPYDTNAELPAYVRQLSNVKQRQWKHVWNSAYTTCMNGAEPDAKQCESKAFAEASGVVKHNMISLAGFSAKEGVLKLLNIELQMEVQSINQYILWGFQSVEWGFSSIKELLDLILVDEYDHRKISLERILRLGETPELKFYEPVTPAKDITEIITRGAVLESGAITFLNPAINHCQQVGDNTTAAMLTEILGDEEIHLSYYEREIAALDKLGLPLYLSEKRD